MRNVALHERGVCDKDMYMGSKARGSSLCRNGGSLFWLFSISFESGNAITLACHSSAALVFFSEPRLNRAALPFQGGCFRPLENGIFTFSFKVSISTSVTRIRGFRSWI